MADKQDKSKTEKNSDEAQENLDQFTVLQETENTHESELRAREMEAESRNAMPEDAAAQGALGKALGEDTASLGVAGEVKQAARQDDKQNPDDTVKTPRNVQTDEFEISDPAPIAGQQNEVGADGAGDAFSTDGKASLEVVTEGQPEDVYTQVPEDTDLGGGESAAQAVNQSGVNISPEVEEGNAEESVENADDSDDEDDQDDDEDSDDEDDQDNSGHDGNGQGQNDQGGDGNNGHGNDEDGGDDSNPGQGGGGSNVVDDDDEDSGKEDSSGNDKEGKEDRGHGNDEDGGDNNNPGQGKGGPNAGKDDSDTNDKSDDGSDVDSPGEGPKGNEASEDNVEMGAMLEEGNGNGWHDMVEEDGVGGQAGAGADDGENGWGDVVEDNADDDKGGGNNNGKGKGKNKGGDDDAPLDGGDDLGDMGGANDIATDDIGGGGDGGF